MRSTRHSAPPTSVPPYLGVDLTDRHAKTVRPIDVCGLRPEGGALRAEFWAWSWTPAPAPIDPAALLPELRASRAVMIDGPQGFARPGRTARECERIARAAGRTPDDWPVPGRPYAGFVRSSLELFHELHRAGVSVSPADGAGACEVYPGDLWPRLAGGRLPRKTTSEGRRARRTLLEQLGLRGLPAAPTHDQLDAAVCALVAACVDGLVPGLTLETIGEELAVEEDGRLREGPMFVPRLHTPSPSPGTAPRPRGRAPA